MAEGKRLCFPVGTHGVIDKEPGRGQAGASSTFVDSKEAPDFSLAPPSTLLLTGVVGEAGNQ